MGGHYHTVGAVLEAMQHATEFASLKQLGVDSVGIFGSRPLKVAVSWGNLEAVNLLLAAGASIDAPNEGGDTALHHAIRMGEFNIARRLVQAGADQTARNSEGKLARDLCWHEEWPSLGLASN